MVEGNSYKVSIIVPVYHVEEYIYMCLDSVANQTMQDGVECILVDDCGGDDSINIAEAFVHEYKGKIDFKIIRREKNGGLSAARNTGIESAKGEYLYFLDSDDEIASDCIELMWKLVEKYENVDLVKGGFKEESECKNIGSIDLMFEYTTDRKLIKAFLLKYEGDLIPAQSKLVRRKLILENKLFFKEGIIHEDNYWSFFLAKYVTIMCACPKATYLHRFNPTSITGNVNCLKEAIAYKTIIRDLCNNVDPFLKGIQKEYILSNYITASNGNYIDSESERNDLLSYIKQTNSLFENLLLNIYILFSKRQFASIFLHLLLRVYKH